MREGATVCGVRCRNCGGACTACGHVGERNARHGGECPKCKIGMMVCQAPPVEGSDRCRMHGGKVPPKGPFHHARKHGGYSILQQPGILEKVREKVRDPELLDMRRDVALLTVRVEQLTENPNLSLAAINAGLQRVQEIQEMLDPESEAWKKLEAYRVDLRSGLEAIAGWEEIERLTIARTSIISKERALEIKSGVMVAASAVGHAMNRLLQVIIQNVPDKDVITLVRNEYNYFMGIEEEKVPS